MLHKNQFFSAITVFSLFIFSTWSFADPFSYFQEDINYWSHATPSGHSESDTEKPITAQIKKSDESDRKEAPHDFEWQKYLDPKRPEFFKEGDYTPPEPFMEVARDPSDYNLKMWFAYIEKKNALAARLQEKLAEYAAKSAAPSQMEQKPVALTQPSSPQEVSDDIKRFQFRMYFDSQCPHCQKMMTTLAELAERGYFVEAKQIDDRHFVTGNLPFVVSKASRDEITRHHISSVPFLLVADQKAKAMYKLSGFKTTATIFQEIRGGHKQTL